MTFVGGCCGTTPAHIRNLVRSVRMLQPAREVVTVLAAGGREGGAGADRRARRRARSARKLGKKFVVSVELDPPKGADPGRIIDRAQYCKENEVDAINVADGPRASARMSAQSLCVLMQSKVGIDTILHYTCRDRNLLGIQSDLLGAYALGLRNILAITGDPPKLGDYPDATAVYDVDSIGLIRIMSHLNHGCDLAGNPIGPALGIHIGCGADPSKPDHDKEIRRLEEKVKAGAEYIMTQPVYDPRDGRAASSRSIKHLDVPVLIGILPLYSHKNAEFLHNEVPGMTIPEDIRERMRKAGLRRGRARRGRAASPRRRCAPRRTWPRAPTSCRPSTRSSWPSASSRGCAEARSHGIPGRTRPPRRTDRGRRPDAPPRPSPAPRASPGSVFPVAPRGGARRAQRARRQGEAGHRRSPPTTSRSRRTGGRRPSSSSPAASTRGRTRRPRAKRSPSTSACCSTPARAC